MIQTVYQIDVSYACGGIVVERELVRFTAPVFKRQLMGKHISEVFAWVKAQKGTIVECKV